MSVAGGLPGDVPVVDPTKIRCFYPKLENTNPPNNSKRLITVTLRYSASNPPPYPTTIHNLLDVRSDPTDKELDSSTNHSDEPTTVTSPGDIRLTKTHGGNTAPDTQGGNPAVPVANNFTWQIKIDNTADAATPSPPSDDSAPWTVPNPLEIIDTLPPGFEFAGTAADPAFPNVDNACNPTPATIDQPSTVTCHPQVAIPGHGTYLLNLRVRPIATSRLPFTNSVTGTKFGDRLKPGDPALITPGDDSSADKARVVCPTPGTTRQPFLCLTKTDGEPPAALHQGQAFTYTLGIINELTGSDQGFTEPLTVTDQIPAGMTVLSAAPNGPEGAPSSVRS